MSTVAASKTLSAIDKRELIKEVLGHRYTSAGNNIPLFNKVIDFVSYTDNVFTAAELITYTNTLVSGSRFLTAVASGASVLSIALLPVSHMISIINAWQSGHRAYAYRGISYAITAWAFNKPVPTASQTILRNIRSGGLVRNPSIVQEYNKVWNEATSKVVAKINTDALSAQVPKDAIKIILRAFSDGSEQKLCEMLLRSFENQFEPIPKITWKSNYKIKYPL